MEGVSVPGSYTAGGVIALVVYGIFDAMGWNKKGGPGYVVAIVVCVVFDMLSKILR